ncbi:hypothetical protein [Lactiplantibacillus pentosus]|uniref:CHAD domain-containing protein n=1 Tax=Lactiplantibacillus pentosus TaxID=1589 RepID=A0AB37RLX7_LACPE|nr:hypothetical protein [Lactiplantibacillus pentosus]RMW49943.1 hypothetical protein D6U20_00205 [Lactiplantibacillus pentosus]RMW50476.1 hypothetical protein D6U19_00065 [Lactiplantibacillus pentosus]RMW57303.1 hypothetical protein D6U17_00785 [Lactiplantibacillus pentosus]RMW57669.1 hypothetical protein D6U21_00690 [Lactiplantibacillus pentosus]
MINESTLNSLLKWRTFKTNVHLSANQLKLSDSDATQELLDELVSHRFKRYSTSQLSELITAHDTNLGWSITYARLDLVSKHYKQLGKRAQMEHAAELEDVSTGIIKLANDNGDTTNISEFKLQQVVSMFPTDKTRLFVDMTLRYGKLETMAVLKLNNKQYARRLRNATAYATKHRSKFDLVTDRDRDRQLYVLNSLNQLDSIINETQIGTVQDWIDSHVKLTNELLSESTVSFQGAVLNHWETASNKDKYAFIRAAINAQTKAQQWLDQSNAAIKQAGVSNEA